MAWFRSLVKGVGLGAAVGAAVMYLSDPVSGRRRRTRLQNRARTVGRGIQEFRQDFREHGAQELTGRWSGAWQKVRGWFAARRHEDRQLVDRVRSVMSRYVAHPSAIDVSVDEGTIILTGPILADEVQPFIRALESIQGVAQVENHLEVHETDETGELSQYPRRWRWRWRPGRRTVAIGSGLGLLGAAVAGSTLAAASVGGLGLGLMMRRSKKTSKGGWSQDSQSRSRKSRRATAAAEY